MQVVILDVARTENKRRVKIGEVEVTVPVLEDIIPHVVSAKITGTEDGLPVYDNDPANWLMSAIAAYTKASARNKLVPQTASLRDGAKISTNWDQFCSEADRGGNGAALQLMREVKDEFAKWVAKQGKSEATQKAIIQYFNTKTALLLAPASTKEKMQAYVEDFAESLDPETQERYTRPLEAVYETCASEVSADIS